ncbi:cadherin-related tumor suppressor [Patella vulgata]|uniref:cadherin-related tumor suppressor n=1 Tax=Patella vulgata TaxID=6465 RepID=UPI002180633B|nr:cadherin-related tumor suppressor [Patella vulgata]
MEIMRYRISIVICLVYILRLTPAIIILNAPIVTNVEEGLEIGSKLGEIKCLNDTIDPDFRYKVTLISVTPTTNCGGNGECFSIRSDNDDSDQPIYNIFHYPFANNRIQYSVVNEYKLTFDCEDQNSTTRRGIADVRVVPNMAPQFVTKSGESVTKAAADLTVGALVFTVSARDAENNELTYSQQNSFQEFVLDSQTGQIRVVEGFEAACTGTKKFNFQVTVKDAYHEFLTPITVDLNIDYPRQPTLIGANQEVSVSEKAPVGQYFHSFNVEDGTLSIDNGNPITPASIADKFTLQSDVLRIKEQFNFEEASTGNISFAVTNGVCRKLFYLIIKVIDENDKPILLPKTQTGMVEEGFITYDPQTFIDDEDILDTHTYKIVTALIGNTVVTDRFSIDSLGVITSDADFDLDANQLNSQAVDFVIEVTDSGGLSDTAELTLTITNANDNAPIISNTDIANNIMDCDPPMLIETIKASDADTGTNGQIIYTATESGPLAVTASGNVYLRSAIAAGSSHTIVVFAEDLGSPPRESNRPATITISGIPCTTTTTTTVATTRAVNITINITTSVNSTGTGSDAGAGAGATATAAASTGFFDNPANLAWVILLAILGLLLLLLLLYLLWRFCFPRCCPGFCGSGGEGDGCCDCCRPKRFTAQPVRGQGDIHDFWQEHYQEQDYGSTVHRSAKPTPAPHELGYLRHD